jgi:hypothetical protein
LGTHFKISREVDLAIMWAESSAAHLFAKSTKLGGNDRENYTGTMIKHETIDGLHQGKCKGNPGPGTHTADVLRV